MFKPSRQITFLAGCLLWAAGLSAQTPPVGPAAGDVGPSTIANAGPAPFGIIGPSPFTNFWQNTLDAHSGTNAFFHLGAVGATGLMIGTGVDEEIHLVEKDFQGAGTEGALILGMVWNIVPAAIVYWSADDNSEYKYASGAVIQAVGLTAGVTTLEKILTGRRGPKELHPDDRFKRTNDPADFNFVPWENFDVKEGRFFWPSGHTASAMTAASALAAFYPDKIWLHVTTYTATAWMGFSMVDGSHHWASDIVAGALIGHAIGWTVGKEFRRRYLADQTGQGFNERTLKRSFSWQPLWSPGQYGAIFYWQF